MAASDFDITGFGFDADDLPAIQDEHGQYTPIEFDPTKPNAWSVRQWFHEDWTTNKQAQQRPLELEIGSGKGTFLVQHAPLFEGTDFLGVEYARQYWRQAADRARRHQLPNVRLLHTEAGSFVRNHIADHSLTQVHIYFPDPWPKARHNKRRLVQAPFLELLHQKLVDEGVPSASRAGRGPGRIRLATDHLDYFDWMQEHAAKVSHLFERIEFEVADSAGEGELVGTNFERKYREEGRVFNGMILAKK